MIVRDAPVACASPGERPLLATTPMTKSSPGEFMSHQLSSAMSSKSDERYVPSLTAAHLMLVAGALTHSGYTIILEANANGPRIDPVLLSFCRDALATPLLYCYARTAEGPIRWPSKGRDFIVFLAMAAVLGVFQLLLTIGVTLTDATTASLFQSIEPVTAIVLAILTGFETCGFRKIAAALLGAAGVLVLQQNIAGGGSEGDHQKYVIGCILLVVNGALISTFTLLQKSLVDQHRDDPYGPKTTIAHAFLGSIVLIFIALVVAEPLGIEHSAALSRQGLAPIGTWQGIIIVVYAVVLSSVFSYTLRATANVVVPVSMLMLYNATQPPFTAILAYLIFRDPFGPRHAGSIALVTCAVALAAYDHHRRHNPLHPALREAATDSDVESPGEYVALPEDPGTPVGIPPLLSSSSHSSLQDPVTTPRRMPLRKASSSHAVGPRKVVPH